mgnify:CR=1 FL=1
MFGFIIRHLLKKILIGISSVFLFVLLAVPSIASAQATTDDPFRLQSSEFANTVNLGRLNLMSIIANGIQIFLGILGIVVVLIFLYAGWVWMTSNGDEEKIGMAKKMMVNASIGLVIILASFAITEFIIRKLTQATGFTPGIGCEDPAYATRFPQQCGNNPPPNYCETYPTAQTCLDEVFVVKSITPVTNNTGMNNVVLRVFFSQSVVSSPDTVVRIYRGTTDVTSDFTFSWVGSNRVLVGIYGNGGESLLPTGTFIVRVQESVRSINSESLKEEYNNNTYPLEAEFTISTSDVRDIVKPEISTLKINNISAIRHIIKRGSEPLITANISDDHGVGLVRFMLRQYNSSELRDITFEGPHVERGSDAPSSSPFAYSTSWLFAKNMSVPTMYEAHVLANDIDSNPSIAATTEVVVVGESCDATGGSIDPSNPDPQCLAEPGGPCSADWQCASGVCDEQTNMCLPYPVILDVSPWGGAQGNMVTIVGKYFGDVSGKVYFGFDVNNDTTISDNEWILADAPTLECPESDLWADNWAIVKVPSNDVLPLNSRSVIRIVRGDAQAYQDTTVNERGPKAGDDGFGGYFEVTNDSYPGLCSVKTVDGGLVSAVPDTDVVARGVGFGTARGQVLFGGRNGNSITGWTTFSTQVRIPENLQPGLVPVQIVDVNQKKSNAIPFRILSANEDTLPLIESIDPATTTRRSFVTVLGKRFGTQVGHVWISSNANDILQCGQRIGRPTSCVELSYGGYDFCAAHWWRPNQIFAYIPETLAYGRYYIMVQTVTGLQTDGRSFFDVVNGAPRPSICSLSPDNGPAPLPSGHPGLVLRGINLNDPTVYFWKNGASSVDPVGTWLSSLRSGQPGTTLFGVNSTTIKTTIPVTVSGVTMQSGPIVTYIDGVSENRIVGSDFESNTGSWIFDKDEVRGYYAGIVSSTEGGNINTMAQLGVSAYPSGPVRNAAIRQNISGLLPGVTYQVVFSAQQNNGTNNTLTSVVSSGGESIQKTDVTLSEEWNEYMYSFVPTTSSVTVSWLVGPLTGEVGIINIDAVRVGAVTPISSNRATYTVSDCRTDSANRGVMVAADYQCCTEGPEAGIWKNGNAVCEGQTRDAGYVWRFTTGKLSSRPTVVEECNYDNTNVTGDIPSPVPSTVHVSGRNACINQMVTVRFSVNDQTVMVDGASATSSAENLANVDMYLCGSTDNFDTDDCNTRDIVDLTGQLSLEGNVLTIYDASTKMLEPNRWYRVGLSKNIQALSQIEEFGSIRNELVFLRPTRPCIQNNKEYAYCFEFRTSELGEQCVLTSAGITPREQHARILGRVNDVFGNAILFSVFGRGNQACTVLNVDRLGWNWSDENTSIVHAVPKASPRSIHDSKANADAKQITTEAGSDIFASVLLPQLIVPSNTVIPPKGIRETRFQSQDISNVDCGIFIGESLFSASSTLPTISCALKTLMTSVSTNDGYNQLQIVGTSTQPFLYRRVTTTQEAVWSPFQSGSFGLSLTTQLSRPLQTGEGGLLYVYKHYETDPTVPIELMYVMVTDANRLRVYVQYPFEGSTINTFIETTRALAEDTLYHVAFVYNRSVGKGILYVNGEEWGSATLSNVPSSVASVGQYSDVQLGYMFGNFDTNPLVVSFGHVGVYNTALSAQEVLALSNMLLNVPPPVPVGSRTITATSTIIINPGKPKVVDYWPRCTEACVNAGLGATFNRPMVTSTYGGNFVLKKCSDEMCVSSTTVSSLIALDTQLSDSQRIVFNLQGTNTTFSTNTWYVMSLTDGIRAYVGEGSATGGEKLEPFSWKFRTKSDGTLCVLSEVRVLPLNFVANVQYQKTLYSAQALSEPDTCSPQGQVLNPWFFDWSWSSMDMRVATVSNIKSGGTYYPWCTNACLPAGSTIARASSTPSMCGDGSVGAGEDCDIAGTGEVPGVSCTFSCVRPGNTRDTCGDGVVSSTLGEECDAGGRASGQTYLGGEFCSSICTNIGSSNNPTGSVTGSVCGSNTVTNGEECEIGQKGCTEQCLHAGTMLSRGWCDDRGYSTSTVSSSAVTACKTAVSVCGNNKIESGESCEIISGTDVTSVNCSDRCVIVPNVSVCNTSLSQCVGGTAGCSDECTLLGASVAYTNPSICGDVSIGAVQTGKDLSCQMPIRNENGVVVKKGLPVQAVTAIGGGDLVSTTAQYQQTLISAVAINTGVGAGEGNYYYQCGYTEYDTPVNGAYNTCVDPTQGVGANSCCYARPVRVDEYPKNRAGFAVGSEDDVCRNTAIMAYMRGYIDQNTLNNNVRVVSYHPGATSCPGGLADVTGEYTDARIFSIAKNTLAPLSADANIFERVWYRIRTFVVRLFGESARADALTDGKLCAGIPITGSVTIVGDGTYANTTSTVRLQIGAALLSDTVYYVTLDGGKDGIKDMFGVGIKHPTTSTLADAWSFRTGAEICKLDTVAVTPAQKLFQSPNATSTFAAVGKTVDNQKIESIPGVYAYDWMWVPGGNPLFDIPVVGSERMNTSTVDIGSKNIEGSLYASAVAIVTEDTDTTSASHINKSFSGRTLLTSLFCNNVWPPVSGGLWTPFEDSDFHFRSFYCADAGTLGVMTDDLPLMSVVAYTSSTAGGVFGGSSIPGALTDDDVIRRYLLVSDKNDDVIGVQILNNPARESVSDWYQRRFGASSQQRVVIDGYEALTNGDTFYIGAYNQVTTTPNKLYNNIYVVTINQGAQTNTRAVLDQFIRNLKFNTNIYDDQYCLTDGENRVVSDRACTTDFDCRSANGTALTGLSGVCGNDRSKFFNDLKRLQDIGAFQRAIDQYKVANNGAVPALAAGTYYPGYTNSMWPSWQATLGGADALSAALPRDPVNRWSQCGVEGINAQTCWNQASSTYACPTFSQIYEYKQQSTSTYMLYAGFEYLNDSIRNASNTPFIHDFIDPALVSETPWCVGEIRSPFGEKCGDGIVQPTETCEIGQTDTKSNVVAQGVYGTVSLSCNATCDGWFIVGNEANMTCGNGVVERSGRTGVSNEVCDDGSALNGTYGHCNNTCSGASVAYCGNGSLDRSDTQPLEYCDNNTTAGVCEYVTGSGVQVRPKVYIMLDRSQSMGTVRWSNAKAGLDIFASSSASLVETGLAVFAGDDSCGAPRQLLAMGSNTIGQIQSSYSSESAASWTPTDVALQYVYDNRSTIFGSNRDIPKIVILVTDGEPVCPSDLTSTDATSTTLRAARQQRAVTNAQLLRNAGIAVHVIGFGDVTESLMNNLNQIAEAGGTDNADDPDNRFYDASNATQLSTAIRSILSCSPYSATRAGSCAYDCQSVGSYCGDGVTDLQFGEQCDDANTNPTDACDNTCKTVVNPTAPTRDPGRHYCGDGVRDWEDVNNNDIKDSGEGWTEACDTGASNLGKRPNPDTIPYGEVRTYCSVDCQDILTVDSAARCGNGKVDFRDTNGDGAAQIGEYLEACDMVPVTAGKSGVTTSTTGVATSTTGVAVDACLDKGSVTCTNSCQTYANNCVACVASTTPSVVGFATPRIAILNPMISNATSDSAISWGKTLKLRISKYDSLGGVSSISGISSSSTLTSQEEPVDFMQLFPVANNGARLQASAQCSEYALRVSSVSEGGVVSYFPYPVHSELSTIDNEYVFSPAVPTNTYRVVVRWTDKESQQGVSFVGGVYSDGFSAFKADINYTNMWGVIGGMCNQVAIDGSLYPGFWWPSGCTGFPSVTNPVVYTHEPINSDKIYTQSITIDTTRMPSAGAESIAVYVIGLRSLFDTPMIGEFKNSNLIVDVYGYRSDQDPAYSLYEPLYSYSIKNARRSVNPDAVYWHVFNLVKSGSTYRLQSPNGVVAATGVVADAGAIVTDMCAIRAQLPGSSVCAP